MNKNCTCPGIDRQPTCPDHGYKAHPEDWPGLYWRRTGEMRWAVTIHWVRGPGRDSKVETRVLEQLWEAWIEHNAGCTQRVDEEWRGVPSVIVKEDRSALA